jgi:hypothetical protein
MILFDVAFTTFIQLLDAFSKNKNSGNPMLAVLAVDDWINIRSRKDAVGSDCYQYINQKPNVVSVSSGYTPWNRREKTWYASFPRNSTPRRQGTVWVSEKVSY